jgi:hypothetical protein
MFTESIDKVTASHKATRRHHFLSLLIAFVFGLMIYPTQANAQIIGDVEASIPFQFHAGNTKFPAGQYRIHVLDKPTCQSWKLAAWMILCPLCSKSGTRKPSPTQPKPN